MLLFCSADHEISEQMKEEKLRKEGRNRFFFFGSAIMSWHDRCASRVCTHVIYTRDRYSRARAIASLACGSDQVGVQPLPATSQKSSASLFTCCHLRFASPAVPVAFRGIIGTCPICSCTLLCCQLRCCASLWKLCVHTLIRGHTHDCCWKGPFFSRPASLYFVYECWRPQCCACTWCNELLALKKALRSSWWDPVSWSWTWTCNLDSLRSDMALSFCAVWCIPTLTHSGAVDDCWNVSSARRRQSACACSRRRWQRASEGNAWRRARVSRLFRQMEHQWGLMAFSDESVIPLGGVWCLLSVCGAQDIARYLLSAGFHPEWLSKEPHIRSVSLAWPVSHGFLFRSVLVCPLENEESRPLLTTCDRWQLAEDALLWCYQCRRHYGVVGTMATFGALYYYVDIPHYYAKTVILWSPAV